jgi:hypothetical protein
MKITSIPVLTMLAMLLCATPALPHHSNVAFEVNKIVTLTGMVTEFRWVNPHTWIGLSVDDGKGAKTVWAIEGRAPGVLARAGWSRSSMKVGDTVTIDFSPAKDGSKSGLVARVTKSDGTILANAPPATE